MKIICYFNKNLKMSEGKLASQVGHVCKELGKLDHFSFFQKSTVDDKIIVLGLRENKFNEKLEETLKLEDTFSYVQKDLGYTEVNEGTITVFGYIE